MDPETRVDETTRRAALLVATVSSFLSPFMMSSVNVALPTIAEEFHMDAKLLTLVPLAYILGGAVFLLPLGKIADIHGRKKVFTYGVALFAASSILAALSTSGVMLIILRGFQGVGTAVIYG